MVLILINAALIISDNQCSNRHLTSPSINSIPQWSMCRNLVEFHGIWFCENLTFGSIFTICIQFGEIWWVYYRYYWVNNIRGIHLSTIASIVLPSNFIYLQKITCHLTKSEKKRNPPITGHSSLRTSSTPAAAKKKSWSIRESNTCLLNHNQLY